MDSEHRKINMKAKAARSRRGEISAAEGGKSFASTITNPDHKLRKAGRRRFNNEIRELRETFKLNPALFERQWHKRVQGWMHEIQRRARNWAEGENLTNEITREGIIERGRTHVFGVVLIAESVMQACGPEINAKVGPETTRILTNECVKSVATVVDNRLNQLVDKKYGRTR